jgi:transcriptional regulator
MYVPAHFAAPESALADLLDTAPLVDLVSTSADQLLVTPLPMLLDGARLIGHVARNNEHWQAGLVDGGAGSVAIVRGPDAYVTPNWYASKAEHGRVVPTWNYLTVHVHGRLVSHDDPDWVRDVVERLTTRFEADQPTPWQVADAPERFIAGQLRAIVGIELLIESVSAKYKASQNRSTEDQAGVEAGLRGSGDPAGRLIAERIAANLG